MSLFTDDLVGILDMFSTELAILIGMSIGGMIAMSTTIEYPGPVTALV